MMACRADAGLGNANHLAENHAHGGKPMKIPFEQADRPGTHEPHSGQRHPPDGLPSDRFPTEEELRAFLGEELSTMIDMELARMAYERHLARIARHGVGGLSPTRGLPTGLPPLVRLILPTLPVPPELVVADPIAALGLEPPPSQVFPALKNPRVNQRTMGMIADQQGLTQRDRFNRALRKAHQAQTYQKLAAIHANPKKHRMHSMQGPVGTQRFLPWHRSYLLQMENLLRTYEPTVRIPYWDFANDHERPDWVWAPEGVERPAPGGASLPDAKTVDAIVLTNASYTEFSLALEGGAHNNVHNWCGGTLKDQTSANDPIFWLLHANVDRLWHRWQLTHNGVPALSGQDAVLDPWEPVTAADVDSTFVLGYSYKN
jgi:tyrosinase